MATAVVAFHFDADVVAAVICTGSPCGRGGPRPLRRAGRASGCSVRLSPRGRRGRGAEEDPPSGPPPLRSGGAAPGGRGSVGPMGLAQEERKPGASPAPPGRGRPGGSVPAHRRTGSGSGACRGLRPTAVRLPGLPPGSGRLGPVRPSGERKAVQTVPERRPAVSGAVGPTGAADTVPPAARPERGTGRGSGPGTPAGVTLRAWGEGPGLRPIAAGRGPGLQRVWSVRHCFAPVRRRAAGDGRERVTGRTIGGATRRTVFETIQKVMCATLARFPAPRQPSSAESAPHRRPRPRPGAADRADPSFPSLDLR